MVKDDPSFPPSFPEGGPLAHYRAQASFNWKTMALLLDKEEILRFKVSTLVHFKVNSSHLSYFLIVCI